MHVTTPTVGALLLCAVLLFTGCTSIESLLANTTPPDASLVGTRLTGLSLADATLEFEVEVKNYYAVGIPLTDVGYAVGSGGDVFASGRLTDAGSIPARGRRVVTLPIKVTFAEALRVLEGVRPGDVVPYKATMVLQGNAPGFGAVSLPLEKQGELPIPTVPEVELTGVAWEELSLNRAAAEVTLELTNTNRFPIDLNRLGYDLSLGGRSVADASVRHPPKLGSGEGEELRVPISLRPLDAGLAFFNLLRGNEAAYRIRGTMDATTPFGPLQLPYDRRGDVPLGR